MNADQEIRETSLKVRSVEAGLSGTIGPTLSTVASAVKEIREDFTSGAKAQLISRTD